MDPIKQQFIQEVLSSSKGKNMSNIMPFVMAMSQKAKDSKIDFSDQETELLYETLKASLPKEQQQKLEQIWTIMQIKRKHS
jgi:hypothetical protein